jgi:hypothetical protein
METAYYIAYAAAHAAFGARSPIARNTPFVLGQAMQAPFYFALRGSAPNTVSAIADAVWQDLQRLIELSAAGQWTAKTPVSANLFGPMWPDESPNGPFVHLCVPSFCARLGRVDEF